MTGGADKAGIFHEIPRIDDSRLAEIFAREVMSDLVRQELLSRVDYLHREDGARQETLDYLEFIARVTSHILVRGR